MDQIVYTSVLKRRVEMLVFETEIERDEKKKKFQPTAVIVG